MKKLFLLGLMVGVFILGMKVTANANLIAHWNFDETGGTTIFDSVGGVNGTLTGGASFTITGGIAGGAIEITDGYVDMGNNLAITPAFSLQAWIKTAPGDTSGMTPVSKHWSTIEQGYWLSVNDVGDSYTQTNLAGFYSANGPYITAIGGAGVNDGLWHQLVGVYDNGTTSLYVDGAFAGSGQAGYADNNAHFMIGGMYRADGTPINLFHGLIDEVKVYDNALSAIEVKNLYDNTLNPAAPVPVCAGWKAIIIVLTLMLMSLYIWRR